MCGTFFTNLIEKQGEVLMADNSTATAKPISNIRCVLPYKDLREWLVEVEKLGELVVA